MFRWQSHNHCHLKTSIIFSTFSYFGMSIVHSASNLLCLPVCLPLYPLVPLTGARGKRMSDKQILREFPSTCAPPPPYTRIYFIDWPDVYHQELSFWLSCQCAKLTHVFVLYFDRFFLLWLFFTDISNMVLSVLFSCTPARLGLFFRYFFLPTIVSFLVLYLKKKKKKKSARFDIFFLAYFSLLREFIYICHFHAEYMCYFSSLPVK